MTTHTNDPALPRPEAAEAVAWRKSTAVRGEIQKLVRWLRDEGVLQNESTVAFDDLCDTVASLYASPTPLSVDREKDSARLDWLNAAVPTGEFRNAVERVVRESHTTPIGKFDVRVCLDAAMSTTDRTGGENDG